MKELLLVPLLTAAFVTIYVALSKAVPIRRLWQPNQILLLCGMMAMAPGDDWWILVLGGMAGAFATLLFIQIAGGVVVVVAAGIAGTMIFAFPEVRSWVVPAFVSCLVGSLFGWATWVREQGSAGLVEERDK